jgi:hypothetical protein
MHLPALCATKGLAGDALHTRQRFGMAAAKAVEHSDVTLCIAQLETIVGADLTGTAVDKNHDWAFSC